MNKQAEKELQEEFGNLLFSKSDARILMSNAVCYALMTMFREKDVFDEIKSILTNDENEFAAKQLYIQSIMFALNNTLIEEWISEKEN